MAQNLLLSYYGDDFSGSIEVLETLSNAGIPALLFLDPPTEEQLAEFPHLGAFGIAGTGRNMTPEQMDRHLPGLFTCLRESGASLVQYKISSTFDSSSRIGSIGRAIDLAYYFFANPVIPLVVGAPTRGRYCVFGNLFASSYFESKPFRLDWHPAMRRHPLTPMEEADLRMHLARQTERRVGLFDVLDLALSSQAQETRLQELQREGSEIILFDTLYPEHLAAIGRLIWDVFSSQEGEAVSPLFCVGSSGLEDALIAYWQEQGHLSSPPPPELEPVEAVLAVSGSSSQVTARQIEHACQSGFVELALETERLADPATLPAEIARAAEQAGQLLNQGKSVIAHLCVGPDDPRLTRTRRRLNERGQSAEDSGHILGEALGRFLKTAWEASKLSQVVIIGSETANSVVRSLEATALEVVAPIAPGVPLCRIVAPHSPLHNRSLVFKGGQVGKPDFLPSLLGQPDA